MQFSVTMRNTDRTYGVSELIVPEQNAEEARLVPGAKIRAAKNLQEVIDHITGKRELPILPLRELELDMVTDRIMTDMWYPYVIGFRRPLMQTQSWWRFVDIDLDAQKKYLAPN